MNNYAHICLNNIVFNLILYSIMNYRQVCCIYVAYSILSYKTKKENAILEYYPIYIF